MSWNVGFTKWRLRWELFKGSSLNLGWSKCDIWLVDQWMSISWLHIESFLCMLGNCIGTLIWLIIFIGASDATIFSVLHRYICLRHWHGGVLLIDYLALLSTSTLFLPWLFWSPRMYIFIVVYHLTLWVDSHACILSWSASIMTSVSLFILIVISCVWTWWYICTLLDCVSHDCPPSAWLYVVCPCGLHIYPLTSNSLSFGHSLHSGSHFCKCEVLCCLLL